MSNEIRLPIQEIALGLTDYLTEIKVLAPNAKDYRYYNLNPYAPGFSNAVLNMMQNATKIHFNLTGMSCINEPSGVLFGPKYLNSLGSTNWELRTIWDDNVLLQKTVFYREGKSITHDQVAKLP